MSFPLRKGTSTYYLSAMVRRCIIHEHVPILVHHAYLCASIARPVVSKILLFSPLSEKNNPRLSNLIKLKPPIYIYAYVFNGFFITQVTSTYQDLFKRFLDVFSTKGEDFKHPGELETSTCAIRLGCWVASRGTTTKQRNNQQTKNNWVFVFKYFLFSPLLGEDSHFD